MDLLIVLASIGLGLAIAYLLGAKPVRIWHLRRRKGLTAGQSALATDLTHQQLLHQQQIRQVEAERDRIAAENQQLRQQLATALNQLKNLPQIQRAVIDEPVYQPHIAAPGPSDEHGETAAVLTSQLSHLEQSIHTAEQQFKELREAVQEQELCRDLTREELENLRSRYQALIHEKDYLQQENARLENHYYHLIEVEEITKRCRSLEQENEQLTQAINPLEARILECNNRLEQQHEHKENLRRMSIVSPCHHRSDQQIDLFHVELDLNFNRVVDAVDFAEYLFRDVLEIWDSARDSAFIANYASPTNVYLNLQSLAWFGKDYFSRNGDLGMPIYQRLSQLGCNYSSESDAVKSNEKLRSWRNFRNGQQYKIMYDHLKLGTRGGDGSLRIYFALNDDTQKIEVGYCGKHLPNKSS